MKYIALLRRINISTNNINQEPKEYKKINRWNKITQKYPTIRTTNTIKKVLELARG